MRRFIEWLTTPLDWLIRRFLVVEVEPIEVVSEVFSEDGRHVDITLRRGDDVTTVRCGLWPKEFFEEDTDEPSTP